MVTNALVHRPVDTSEWGIMREQAKVLVSTGFLPAAVKTPEQALAIMLKGRELNVPPMYALSNITVIQGKPTAGAELMLALIYRDHGDDSIRFKESTAERCTVTYKRRTWAKVETFTFSIEDAKRAGLTSSPTWQKYTPALLRARCVSAIARMAFADSIGGMYTPEELGARVTVNDQDEMTVVLDETEVETIPDARRHVEDEGPRAPNARDLPPSRLEAPTATPEPAVMTAETEEPEDAAGELATIFAEEAVGPLRRDDGHTMSLEPSPLREEVRALHKRVVDTFEFRNTKLPLDTDSDAKWSVFLDYWPGQLEQAKRAAERRGTPTHLRAARAPQDRGQGVGSADARAHLGGYDAQVHPRRG